MSKSLEQWLDEDVSKCDRMSVSKLSNEYFFRDPSRPNYINHEYFFSPADGVILYQKFIHNPKDPIVEIKGMNYTLQDVIGDPNYDKPSLVIGIFMTFYDSHIIRVPYNGIVKYKMIDSIESYNIPMLATEKDILKAAINPINTIEFIKNNERMSIEVYSPILDYKYNITLIADSDVDVIVPFCLDQNVPFSQNQRFGLVRWGSMTCLTLPLDDRFSFELYQSNEQHIEAGLDKIIKVNYK